DPEGSSAPAPGASAGDGEQDPETAPRDASVAPAGATASAPPPGRDVVVRRKSIARAEPGDAASGRSRLGSARGLAFVFPDIAADVDPGRSARVAARVSDRASVVCRLVHGVPARPARDACRFERSA
ncbi:MAG: hypothetical protein AAF928_05780, partial [Myxococcota bacterium]